MRHTVIKGDAAINKHRINVYMCQKKVYYTSGSQDTIMWVWDVNQEKPNDLQGAPGKERYS